jgi:hypothetical protein
MARRPDPLRLYAARRAGLFQRLISEGKLSKQTSELRLSAYESHAGMLHLDARKPEWWDGARAWIVEQRGR